MNKKYLLENVLGKKCRIVLLLCAALLAGPLFAAELQSLAWQNNSVELVMDKPTQYSTTSLEGGLRQRLTLQDTSLSPKATDIDGRGVIKGVFPYIADDGKSVHVDFLLKEKGSLSVERTGTGYIVVAGGGGAAPAPAASRAMSDTGGNRITKVLHSIMPNGGVEIVLKMDQRPAEPGTFSITKPARISFDFFNTSSELGKGSIAINQGVVNSLTAIEADDRTRVVLNLSETADYRHTVNDDGVTIRVAGAKAARSKPTKPKPVLFARGDKATKHSLQNVDFRRGAEGEGKVIVSMSDSAVGIDISEDAGEVILDFNDTSISDELERRLDVVDFATPVQTIDTFRRGNNTRIIIKPLGRFEHLAYQTGNVFTVSVKPVKAKSKEELAAEKGYVGERLSLNFQNIEVRAALQVIADFTGLNFVTSDSVKGSLTLRLKDVPWDQALDIIMNTKGLAKRQKGNIIWVAPAEEIANKEQQQLEATKTVAELEPLISELVRINYAKAADIAKLLKSVKAVGPQVDSKAFSSVTISSVETETNSLLSPRGNVTVDARTNSILIQDTAGKIRQIKKLITKLDQPVRQVMIETRIVEANDDFSRSLGARFGITNRNRTVNVPGATDTNLGDGVLTGRLENTEAIYNENTYLVNEEGLNFDLPSTGLEGNPAAALAFTLFKTSATHLLALELSALEAEGEGKIIANPRLVTANQKQAHIEQGQERVFPPSGFADSATVVEAKLSLTVTPQITPEDSIILDVFITQDAFVAAGDPTVNTKQINTQVLLENGETVVIGGIYQQKTSSDVYKIPLLGDLPFVGNLFKNRVKVDEKTELLIFLTPRIISPTVNLASG
jgi:type IV pilus assembly protein PilQ